MTKSNFFISPPQSAAQVVGESKAFTPFWIKWFNGVNNAISIVESNSDTSIATLDAKFSRTDLYYCNDVANPLTIVPSAGEIGINIAGSILTIHKTPKGGAPVIAIDDVLKVLVYSDKTLAASFYGLTIVDNTTYYTVTGLSNYGAGAWTVTDLVSVTFQW